MSLNVHSEWDIRFVTTNYTGGRGEKALSYRADG